MTVTHWTLASTLQSRGLSAHALVKASGLSKTTVYAIVNGKTQGITMETVDRLLEGLEQLTGQRLPLEAVLARDAELSLDDPALLSQLGGLPVFDAQAVLVTVPRWTPEQQAENERLWLAHESDRRTRGDRRSQRLDTMWEELDQGDVPT